MSDLFENLLRELSLYLNIPLHVDKLGCCAIVVEEKLKIQLELDRSEQFLVLAGFVAKLDPGKFRENILLEALKANEHLDRIGTFGFNPYDNTLALFYLIDTKNLHGEKLKDIIAIFIGRSLEWQNAILAGHSVPTDESSTKPFSLG